MLPVVAIESAITLIQMGLTTGKAIVDIVRAGRVAVVRADGTAITADQVETAIASALVAGGHTGASAAGRIDDRHTADGTGEP